MMMSQKAQILKIMSVFIGALLIMFVFSPALAQSAPPQSGESEQSKETSALEVEAQIKANYVLCKKDKLVRTIRVTKQGSGFIAQYAKEGITQIIGRAKNEQVCIDILTKLKATLEAGNWSCKDISSSKVSEPSSGVESL